MPEIVDLPAPVAAIYKAVAELEEMYPGRKFTPDGHLVGSIGEVIAQERFGLELLPMSAARHDGVCKDRGKVQVKITGGKSVALRDECEHLIVLRITSPETAVIEYDGPGKPVWDSAGPMQKNGQRQIGLGKLRELKQRNPN